MRFIGKALAAKGAVLQVPEHVDRFSLIVWHCADDVELTIDEVVALHRRRISRAVVDIRPKPAFGESARDVFLVVSRMPVALNKQTSIAAALRF